MTGYIRCKKIKIQNVHGFKFNDSGFFFFVIPVTSCFCKRTFRILINVETKSRSTIRQDRLESLMLLYVELEFTVEATEVVEDFKNVCYCKLIIMKYDQ